MIALGWSFYKYFVFEIFRYISSIQVILISLRSGGKYKKLMAATAMH